MLALQAVEPVEPLLDRLQTAGLGIDLVQVGAQLATHVLELDRGRAQPRRERVEVRIDALDTGEPGLGQPERRSSPAAILDLAADRPECPAAGLAQRLGMAQAFPICLQLGVLGHVGCRRLDLGELEAQQVEVALARALALAQVRQFPRERRYLSVRRRVLVPDGGVPGPGEAVEGLELGGTESEPTMLVLAVEREQASAERLQVGGRCRPSADEGAGPPRGAHPPAQDHLVGALGDPLGDLGKLGFVEEAVGQREHPLHPGLLGAGADDLRSRPAAQQEVERVGEHRLARPGLAGDRVQAGVEPELGPLDQEQVLDSKLEQHAPVLAPGADGSTRPPARGLAQCASRPNFSRIRR